MRLRSPIVFTLFRAELRMLLRDRRVLLTSLVLPMLITPLLMLGSKTSVERREKALREMTYRYAVTGSEAASVRELVRVTSARVDSKSKTNQHRFKFAEQSSRDATNALAKGSVLFADNRLYVLSEEGEMALLRPTDSAFEFVGGFRLVPERRTDVWTHPVILNGRLYLRYHDTLWCYDVAARKSGTDEAKLH